MPTGLTRMFIYVHHSKSGSLEMHDERVLLEAKLSGYSTILISNGQHKKYQNVDFFHQKSRFGRDFSVLRDMARTLKFSKNQSVEFFYLNDSMIWKVNGISMLLAELDKSKINTLTFPTESYNPRYHVQPYFLFTKIEKEKFNDFSLSFEWIRNFHFKRSLIYLNEYRMAYKLVEKNWKIEVLAPYWEILEVENRFRERNFEECYDSTFKFYNPTQHFWRALSIFHIQGVKKSLINKNPVGITNPPSSFRNALNLLHK
jgi:hypothetical protein